MARSRNIKPGFFKNDALADCGPVCMVAFAGLWCIADYQGNLEYRPKRIKIDTIPYFDESIEECIDALEAAGFVYRYSIDGKEYLHIRHFAKHQNPHKNERDSGTSIPEPIQDGIETEVIPEEDESDRADSLNLIPDSLVPNGNGDSIPEAIPFDGFWNIYPRKTNKAKAEQAWKKLKPSEEVLILITENIRSRLAAGDWELTRKDYIPHPSTYLNGKRWEDEVIAKEQGHAASQSLSAIDKVRQATGQHEQSGAAGGEGDGSVVASYG